MKVIVPRTFPSKNKNAPQNPNQGVKNATIFQPNILQFPQSQEGEQRYGCQNSMAGPPQLLV